MDLGYNEVEYGSDGDYENRRERLREDPEYRAEAVRKGMMAVLTVFSVGAGTVALSGAGDVSPDYAAQMSFDMAKELSPSAQSAVELLE